jgi:hypothetical protein
LCVFKRPKVLSLQIETDEVDAEIQIVEFEHGLAFFSLSEIRDSTGNFATSNMIDKGGFNTVYRALFTEGHIMLHNLRAYMSFVSLPKNNELVL